MKFDYELEIKTNGSNEKVYKEIVTSYGMTKNILFKVYSNKIVIKFTMSTLKTIKDFLKGNLYKNLILKSNVAYCLICKRGLKIKNITIKIESEEETIDVLQNDFITNIIEDKKIEEIKINDDELEYIMNIKESNYHNKKEYCSLCAYLASFSTDNVYEKFGYLWTSMNSLYCFKYPDEHMRERTSLSSMLKDVSWGKEFPLPDQTTKYKQLYGQAINELQYVTNCEEMYDKVLRNDIDRYICLKSLGDKFKIKTIGVMTLVLPYYFRCNFFHGSKAVFLFYSKNSKDYKVMQLLSYYVKKYLQENIHTLFANKQSVE